jgi:hypothetical protein
MRPTEKPLRVIWRSAFWSILRAARATADTWTSSRDLLLHAYRLQFPLSASRDKGPAQGTNRTVQVEMILNNDSYYQTLPVVYLPLRSIRHKCRRYTTLTPSFGFGLSRRGGSALVGFAGLVGGAIALVGTPDDDGGRGRGGAPDLTTDSTANVSAC